MWLPVVVRSRSKPSSRDALDWPYGPTSDDAPSSSCTNTKAEGHCTQTMTTICVSPRKGLCASQTQERCEWPEGVSAPCPRELNVAGGRGETEHHLQEKAQPPWWKWMLIFLGRRCAALLTWSCSFQIERLPHFMTTCTPRVSGLGKHRLRPIFMWGWALCI